MNPQRARTAELLALALISTAAALWGLIPEHERQLMVMRSLDAGRRLAARAAAGQGHAGMGDELDERGGQARQHYGAAARLGQLRDELGRRLDRMRP